MKPGIAIYEKARNCSAYSERLSENTRNILTP